MAQANRRRLALSKPITGEESAPNLKSASILRRTDSHLFTTANGGGLCFEFQNRRGRRIKFDKRQ